MHIFNLMIEVISCISYALRPSKMLLVDKKDLQKLLKKEPYCTLCGTHVYPAKNRFYEEANKTSFLNYCFNHFRCSCCLSVFHANCFVYFRANIVTTCPNPYCSSMYSLSEMERFFGQLLLCYAHNNEPIEEYKNLYDEYRLRMFNNFGINTNQLNSEPVTFASLKRAQRAYSHQNKLSNIMEEIFISTLINGRMVFVLMNPHIWDTLSNYLIKEINYFHKKTEQVTNLLVGDAKRQITTKCAATKQPILFPRDKLYFILQVIRAMSLKDDANSYLDIYLNYVENIEYSEISELRATYFFACLFQLPDALLLVKKSYIVYRTILARDARSSSEIKAMRLDKFKRHFQDTLMSSSEALFRKLYTEYNATEQRQESIAISLDPNVCTEINYWVKMLVRLVLGVGGQPIVYSVVQKDFMFESLYLCSKDPEIMLSPGEICGILKLFNTND
ncbi:hypothetical protein ENBRE01_3018, partial [Enteropsectra breve]